MFADMSVNGRQRIVQQINIRLFVYGSERNGRTLDNIEVWIIYEFVEKMVFLPRQTYSRPLSAAEGNSSFAHDRPITVRKLS